MSQESSTITREQLVANGWTETGDRMFPAKKSLIDKTNPDCDPEIGEWDLVVHCFNNNGWEFGMMLPDGSRIDLNPRCIEDLNAYERMMAKYEPNF